MSAGQEDRCEAVSGDLAELALGTLTGRERSEALVHVESCRRCSAELASLSSVMDTLLELAPAVEPPLGFEQRLMQRLDAAPAPARPHRSRRVALLAAAALALAALGFGAGSLVSSGGGGPAGGGGGKVASAPLRSNGVTVGELFVSGGSPAWMYMTVDAGWASSVTCQVTLAGGRVETVGRFTLAQGYGAWAAPLAYPAGKVTGARLVSASGAVVAAARLPA